MTFPHVWRPKACDGGLDWTAGVRPEERRTPRDVRFPRPATAGFVREWQRSAQVDDSPKKRAAPWIGPSQAPHPNGTASHYSAAQARPMVETRPSQPCRAAGERDHVAMKRQIWLGTRAQGLLEGGDRSHISWRADSQHAEAEARQRTPAHRGEAAIWPRRGCSISHSLLSCHLGEKVRGHALQNENEQRGR